MAATSHMWLLTPGEVAGPSAIRVKHTLDLKTAQKEKVKYLINHFHIDYVLKRFHFGWNGPSRQKLRWYPNNIFREKM